MIKDEFKKEFLTDAFFFIDNKEQFENLQHISIEFGLVNPIGGKDLIDYDLHDVSKKIASKPGVKVAENLIFFPGGRFQKSGFWIRDASHGKSKDYALFLKEYKNLEEDKQCIIVH